MADTFGQRKTGRVFEGGKFYAIPAVDVAANAVFCPAPTTSAQFGVAEMPVQSGELGAFSTVGTFAFSKPDGWTSASGKPIYYKPTTASTGAFAAASSSGAFFFGFEVVKPGIPSTQIWIDIRPVAIIPATE